MKSTEHIMPYGKGISVQESSLLLQKTGLEKFWKNWKCVNLIFSSKKTRDNYSEYYFCLSEHKSLKTIGQGFISDSFTVKMWKP